MEAYGVPQPGISSKPQLGQRWILRILNGLCQVGLGVGGGATCFPALPRHLGTPGWWSFVYAFLYLHNKVGCSLSKGNVFKFPVATLLINQSLTGLLLLDITVRFKPLLSSQWLTRALGLLWKGGCRRAPRISTKQECYVLLPFYLFSYLHLNRVDSERGQRRKLGVRYIMCAMKPSCFRCEFLKCLHLGVFSLLKKQHLLVARHSPCGKPEGEEDGEPSGCQFVRILSGCCLDKQTHGRELEAVCWDLSPENMIVGGRHFCLHLDVLGGT